MTLVLDSSVALAWAFPDERQSSADGVFDQVERDGAIVPPLWPYEIANVLLHGRRRGRLSEVQLEQFLALIDGLSIDVVMTARADATRSSVTLGHAHGLSAYDAAYLALALRRSLPLATLDEQLRGVAAELGVALLP
ncbi:MAG: PIN domain-containing protein [Chloroflexota bacterium]|nr:MAG: PIN domain-containing protein [Chloroflexota bacterium]